MIRKDLEDSGFVSDLIDKIIYTCNHNFPGIKNGKTTETSAALILKSLCFVMHGENTRFFKIIHNWNPLIFVFLPSSSGGIAGD